MITKNSIVPKTSSEGESPSSKVGIGTMYLRIFQLYLDMFARDKALVYGEKALHHYQMIGDKQTLQFILEKMGELYDFFDKYEQALNCYSECEKIKTFNTSLKST